MVIGEFVSQNTFVASFFEHARNCKRLFFLMMFLAVFAYIFQSLLSVLK
jgi:hypothetical protein